LGILVGFSGVALLVSGHNAVVPGGPVNFWGLVALVFAGGAWAAGSLWSRYHPHAASPWMTAAAQMICGGAVLILISFLQGEPWHFHPNRVSGESWLAFAYLVVLGSWVAFSAYIYMLKASTPARIATYAYVNPVIAVLLGWLVLGESLSHQSLWAAAIILAGVVITTLPRKS
jgi:drug/metabolite transporter (DMT)-like permease